MPDQVAYSTLLADSLTSPIKIADVILLPSNDDPTITDVQLSADILRFEAVVGDCARRRQTMCFSANAPEISPWAGDYLIMIPPVATALIAAAGTWFASKSGRKVRLRVGDIEAEASTVEEVELLVERGFQLRKTSPSSNP